MRGSGLLLLAGCLALAGCSAPLAATPTISDPVDASAWPDAPAVHGGARAGAPHPRRSAHRRPLLHPVRIGACLLRGWRRAGRRAAGPPHERPAQPLEQGHGGSRQRVARDAARHPDRGARRRHRADLPGRPALRPGRGWTDLPHRPDRSATARAGTRHRGHRAGRAARPRSTSRPPARRWRRGGRLPWTRWRSTTVELSGRPIATAER